MAIRQKITPNMPLVSEDENRRQNSTSFQDGLEQAHRVNLGMPKDGTEPFEAPLPLQQVATADRPSASDWEGAYLYDTDLGRTIYSDGASWIVQPSPAESVEAAQDAVGSILTDSTTIDFTYNDATPSITADVKADSIDASHIKANAITSSELQDTAVTPGSYTYSSVTVDQDGRITAASSGAAPPLAPAMVLLTSGAASGATLDLPLGAYTAYRTIMVDLTAFIPATDGVDLQCQFSTDNGSTWLNTLYHHASGGMGEGAGYVPGTGNNSDSKIVISNTTASGKVGNGSDEGISVSLRVMGWQLTTIRPRINWTGEYITNAATPTNVALFGGGHHETAQDLTALRFLFSSGNITSGDYAVYGIV